MSTKKTINLEPKHWTAIAVALEEAIALRTAKYEYPLNIAATADFMETHQLVATLLADTGTPKSSS